MSTSGSLFFEAKAKSFHSVRVYAGAMGNVLLAVLVIGCLLLLGLLLFGDRNW